MNARKPVIVLASMLIVLNISAGQPNRLPHLLRELEIGRNKKVDQAQDQALEILMRNPNLSLTLLNCTLDILLFHKERTVGKFEDLRRHIRQVDNAVDLFNSIPGFRSHLIHAICASCRQIPAINHWYEIEGALWIENTLPNETVVAFGKSTERDTRAAKGLLHNIITDKRWIECKTINWGSQEMTEGKKRRNLCRQLLYQQGLIARYNQAQNASLSYELFCKYPVALVWDTWLTEHKIPYHVVPDVLSSDNPGFTAGLENRL